MFPDRFQNELNISELCYEITIESEQHTFVVDISQNNCKRLDDDNYNQRITFLLLLKYGTASILQAEQQYEKNLCYHFDELTTQFAMQIALFHPIT